MAGTEYPKLIDNFAQLPLVADRVSPIVAADYNRIRNAVVAVEKELGIQPSGAASTLRARLDGIQGVLEDGYAAASIVSVEDADGYFVSTNIEDVLAEIATLISSISLDAEDLTLADADGYYASGNVEGALAEASVLIGRSTSASDITIADDGYYYTSTNVEDALAEATSFQNKIDFVSGLIEVGKNKTYHLFQNIPFPITILSSTTQLTDGYAIAELQIDGVQLSGSSHSISSSQTTIFYLASNSVTEGQDFNLTLSNTSTPRNVSFTIVYEKYS